MLKPIKADSESTVRGANGGAFHRQFKSVLGIKTAYHQTGAGTDILLMHGAAPGASWLVNWSTNLEPLAAAGFRVTAFDQPGFGGSAHPNDWGMEFRVWHAQEAIATFSQGPVCLVGNSIGAYQAMRLACDMRGQINALVLISPPPLIEGFPGDLLEPVLAHSGRLTVVEPTEKSIRELTARTVVNKNRLTRELLDTRLAMATGRNFLAQRARSEGGETLGRFILPEVLPTNMPVLFIWGRQDRSVPVECMLPMMAYFPQSEGYVLDECGHWPQWEYPDRVNEIIAGFLKRHTGPGT